MPSDAFEKALAESELQETTGVAEAVGVGPGRAEVLLHESPEGALTWHRPDDPVLADPAAVPGRVRRFVFDIVDRVVQAFETRARPHRLRMFPDGDDADLGALAASGQDAQNMQFAAMMPLMIAFFMGFGVMNDPEGPLAVAGSLIPFTSLIVVPLRAILGAIPWSQTLAAAAILAAACWAVLWVGGRVYRATILATCQRPGLRRIWRLVRSA